MSSFLGLNVRAGRRRYAKNLGFSITSQVVLGLAAAMLGLAAAFYLALANTSLPYKNSTELWTVQLVGALTDSLGVGADLQDSLLLAHQLVSRSSGDLMIARAHSSMSEMRRQSKAAAVVPDVRVLRSGRELWRVLDLAGSIQERLPSQVGELALSHDLAARLFGEAGKAYGEMVELDKHSYKVGYVTPPGFLPPFQHIDQMISDDSASNYAFVYGDFHLDEEKLLDRGEKQGGQLLLVLRSAEPPSRVAGKLQAAVDSLSQGSGSVRVRLEPLVHYMKGSGLTLTRILLLVAAVLAVSVLAGAGMSYFSSANSRGREHFVLFSIGASGQKRFLADDIELLMQFLAGLVLAAVLVVAGGWFISTTLSLNENAIRNMYITALAVGAAFLFLSLLVFLLIARLALGISAIQHSNNVRPGQVNRKARLLQRVLLALIVLAGLVAATLAQGFLRIGQDALSASEGRDYTNLYSIELKLDGRIQRGSLTGVSTRLRQDLAGLPGVRSVAFSQANPIDFRGAAVAYSGPRDMRNYKVSHDSSGERFYISGSGPSPAQGDDEVRYVISHVGVERDLFRMLEIPLLGGRLWDPGEAGKVLMTRSALVAIHGHEGAGYDTPIPAGPPDGEGDAKAWNYSLQGVGMVAEPRVKSPGILANFGSYPLVFGAWNGPLRVGSGQDSYWSMYAIVATVPGYSVAAGEVDNLVRALPVPALVTEVLSLESEVNKRVRQHRLNALGVIALVFGMLLAVGLAVFGMLRFIYQVSRHETGIRLALGMTDRKLLLGLIMNEMWPIILVVLFWLAFLFVAGFLAEVLGISGIPGVSAGVFSALLIFLTAAVAFALVAGEMLKKSPADLLRVE